MGSIVGRSTDPGPGTTTAETEGTDAVVKAVPLFAGNALFWAEIVAGRVAEIAADTAEATAGLGMIPPVTETPVTGGPVEVAAVA